MQVSKSGTRCDGERGIDRTGPSRRPNSIRSRTTPSASAPCASGRTTAGCSDVDHLAGSDWNRAWGATGSERGCDSKAHQYALRGHAGWAKKTGRAPSSRSGSK
jgi:hypothetical protein